MSVTGLISWLGGSGGIYLFFARFDDLATDKTKSDLTAMLVRNPALNFSSRWVMIFNIMFNVIFGEYYLSLRFMSASVITSLLIALAFGVLSYINYPGELTSDLAGLKATFTYSTLVYAWPIFLILDMIGLLKSRFVLRRLGHIHTALLIILDLLSSIALTIFSVCLCLGVIGAVAVEASVGGFADNWSWFRVAFETAKRVLPTFTYDFFHNNPFHSPINAFFYAPMFTSLWIILFYLSVIGLRSTGRLLSLATRFLDLNRKPFSIVGLGAIVVVTIISGCTAVLTLI